MGWDETEEELEWEELEWEVSFRLVSDKYNDVTAPHCTFPSCIFSKSNNGLSSFHGLPVRLRRLRRVRFR